MRKAFFLLLLLPMAMLAQVVAPPAAISNWPTANTALTLADPATINQVAGWDNTNKKFVWVTNGSGGGSFTPPSGTGFIHVTGGAMDGASVTETGSGNVVRSVSPGFLATANNANIIFGRRFTNTSPTGNFLLFDNSTDSKAVFRVDVNGQIVGQLDANNLTGLFISRFTDTSPTGNFLDFRNAAGASLFTIDITGAWTNPSFTAVTTGNATTSQHGLLPTLDGNTAHFLNGNGAWTTPTGSGGITADTFWATKGDLAVAIANDSAQVLPVGTANQVLTVDSSTATGLKWATGGTVSTSGSPASPSMAKFSAATTITNATARTDYWDTTDFVASGASHAHGLVPDPGVTTGTTKFLREDASWQVPSTGTTIVNDTFWAAKGDLAVATANDVAAVLTVGSNNQVLTADSTQATGVKWATPVAGGTVTATGGALTANAVVLGAGTTDTKVVTGITTDGSSVLSLGNNTTTAALKLYNSGNLAVTLQRGSTATAFTITLPDATTTLVGTDFAQTITNKTLDNSNHVDSTGLPFWSTGNAAITLKRGGASGSVFTATLPEATTTLIGTDTTDSLTNKTFTGTANVVDSNGLKFNSTGNAAITLKRGGASGSTFTATLPEATGTLAIAPSGAVVGTTDTQTLTNKRINPRVDDQNIPTSPYAVNSDSFDMVVLRAIGAALTINAPTGTPVQGQKLIYRFKDDGTARTLTFQTGSSGQFRFSSDLVAPPTTIISKTLYVGFIYNSTDSRWDCVSQMNNF